EHATLFNDLHHLSQNQYVFKKRKLFRNSRPSSFLRDDDWAMLLGDYGELLEKVVIELTEQTDTSDENLNYLIGRLRKHKIQMAIDDYGTGYSNTSRLIRYTPDYIKLDHSLISHIDTNVRLQSIVSGLVEMMHSNGFAVLAEGVETAQEMRTLSHMNVDLFQGFYISRPKPIFIHEISEEIQSEIIRYHMESQGDSQKIYTATGNSTISMNELIREKYTSVYISDGEHILEGEPDMPAVIMPVTVKEEAECSLTIKNVKLEAVNDEPCITLGSGSRLKLDIVGENKMIKGGVQVPSKAELELTGGGKLTILAESVSCFAIGNEYDLTYGKIRCDMDGVLIINVCGDNCVGIGGGRSDDNSGIEITRGMMEISCSGAVSLGIGSMQEKADISISGCSISITAASANFTGIGSFESDADVKIHDVKLDVISGGNNQCALGSLHGGEVDILIKRCEMTSNIKGRNIINIGTNSSTALCDISNCLISLYAEGSTASGIGDSAGDGRVSIRDTELHITFMTSNGFAMGCRDGQLHFSGGTKQISINE
ncbi:MAG: EAL domain-containing protein, partial [Ruminococcus sp.]|nr:EAL domain-containing protein [Ruminococcus sp.]